ncbi:methylmalonyl-CoA mutase family protein [soil metagenome]
MEPLDDAPPPDLERRLGHPGQFPFTRGVYPRMYTGGRYWTMRQYAGFGTAEETNERYRYLLAQGVAGLSVAFDLPTQLGMDPDAAEARGEVGRVGVSIATIDDVRSLFDGIPLADVTTSMTINAPAMMLLALYTLEAERQGAPLEQLGGTVQNDILKEYVARGTYIYPPERSMRLVTDLFAWCALHVPRWNTISISGYHIREAGSTAAQEIAFTLANATAYVRAAIAAGLDIESFGPRLSFFFACHNDFFEEVAKFRAARRLWAHVVRDEFGGTERAAMLRFHAQTGGSTLTAQQPLNNVVRTAYQALAAVLGGTQSLHTNAYDEALGLPTAASARLALRTQQILAHESGVAEAIDPLGGSYFVERLTDELERDARRLLDRVEELGGSVRAIELGYLQREIEEAAYAHQRAVEAGERVVVGVNRFAEGAAEAPVPVQHIDPELEARRVAQVRRFREERDGVAASEALARLEVAASGEAPLMPVVRDAFAHRATIGEVCGVLRRLWGEHR